MRNEQVFALFYQIIYNYYAFFSQNLVSFGKNTYFLDKIWLRFNKNAIKREKLSLLKALRAPKFTNEVQENIFLKTKK
ncbi:MAG: hypothetical protein J5629_10820 [Muribaculaceae bacterium]|nr:hypothetical protein [Muribaculaceae bacterium]